MSHSAKIALPHPATMPAWSKFVQFAFPISPNTQTLTISKHPAKSKIDSHGTGQWVLTVL